MHARLGAWRKKILLILEDCDKYKGFYPVFSFLVLGK